MQTLIDKTTQTLLTDSMKQLLTIIFSKLDREVTLAAVVDESDSRSLELKNFVLEIARLHNLITTEVYEKGKNPDMEAMLHADKFPVIALLDGEKYYSGVKFHAIPLEHALNAFALTLYNLGGPGEPMDLMMTEKIMDVKRPADLKVCISLNSSSCVDTVVAAQRLALLNPRIQAEMIDIDLFPDIKNQFNITSVPALIIDDKDVYYNITTLEELVDLLCARQTESREHSF